MLEAHELDSAQAEERGEDAAPWGALRAQRAQHSGCAGHQCAGTLEQWRQRYGEALPEHQAVIHNATAPSRERAWQPRAGVIGYAGSLRAYKGQRTLLEAAAKLSPRSSCSCWAAATRSAWASG